MHIENHSETLLALTLSMYQQAKSGNWEQLVITERRRVKILNHALKNNLLQSVDNNTLQQFHHLQDEIVRLAVNERQRIEKTWKLSRSKIDASQQYLGCSTPGRSNTIYSQPETTYEAD